VVVLGAIAVSLLAKFAFDVVGWLGSSSPEAGALSHFLHENRHRVASNLPILVYSGIAVLLLRWLPERLSRNAVDTFYDATFAFDRMMHDRVLADPDGMRWALWREWHDTLHAPVPGWMPPEVPLVPEEPSVRWGRGDDDDD
jgi:hypothetical protein